jgi:hypothetical protein
MRVLFASVIVGAGIMVACGDADAAVPSPCAEGTRLIVQSSGRKKASPARILLVDADGWRISSGCGQAATPRFRAHQRGVRVRVDWAGCAEPATPASRFRGRLSADCSSLRGVWRVDSSKRAEPVTGQLSRCGDAVQDGEDCDGNAGVCPMPLVCSARCVCEDPALPLDPSFGAAGVVNVDGHPIGLAVDRVGRMLILYSASVRRYSGTGQFEGEFPSGGNDASAILPLVDGGFLVTDVGGTRRFDTNGERVFPFGVGGELPAAMVMRELDDGRIVTFSGDGLRRYLADGTPDPSFTPVPTPVPTGEELHRAAFLADGRLVVVTRQGPPYTLVARRVLTDGLLDLGYGDGGLFVSTPNIGNVTRVYQLLALPDGSLLAEIVSHSVPRASFEARRIGVDGTPDAREVHTSGGLVALDASGRVLVARRYYLSTTSFVPPRLALERRLADGGLDTTFGSSGEMLTAVKGRLVGFGLPVLHVFGLVGLPDGKLLVGAEDRILRLQP